MPTAQLNNPNAAGSGDEVITPIASRSEMSIPFA